MTGTKAILGFVAGISIGAIAGILISPEKGSDTRQMIADRTIAFGNALRDSFSDFIRGKKTPAQAERAQAADPQMTLNTMG